MRSRILTFLCALLALLSLCSCAKPLGGKYTGENGIQEQLYLPKNREEVYQIRDTDCRSLTLYSDGHIYLDMKGKVDGPTDNTMMMIQVSIYRSECGNYRKCGIIDVIEHDPEIDNEFKDNMKIVALYTQNIPLQDIETYIDKINLIDESFKVPTEHKSPPSSSSEEEEEEEKEDSKQERDTRDDVSGNGTATTDGDTASTENKNGDTASTENKNGDTASTENKNGDTASTENKNGDTASTENKNGDTASTENKNGDTASTENKNGDTDKDTNGYKTVDSGLYIVYIVSQIQNRDVKKNLTINLAFNLEMKNYYGYLSAIDYPALVFYGLMTAVYAILGLAWSVAMCCSYRDLVRLQFWVFAVIILGFLEKIFFVSEYSSINVGEDTSFLIMLAEVISALKRALARVLIIIVSIGFGTVKPRLGDSLGKIVAAGTIYFIFAFIDGIVRSKADTYDTKDATQFVTLALLFIMDSIIFYWAMVSLVDVRRALRLRKNYVKLSMYNHFAYTLIFSLIATIAFTIWVFVEVNFPKDSCLVDWQEVWLRDCFWHFLFCVILVVIMIIWRPSANRNRFAYSLVNDLDQDDDIEEVEMENKNFETLKMRSVGKTNSSPPPPTQAEDDLRWVEENLPTTAMDKAMLIIDSDEEVMSTKFEASKLN